MGVIIDPYGDTPVLKKNPTNPKKPNPGNNWPSQPSSYTPPNGSTNPSWAETAGTKPKPKEDKVTVWPITNPAPKPSNPVKDLIDKGVGQVADVGQQIVDQYVPPVEPSAPAAPSGGGGGGSSETPSSTVESAPAATSEGGGDSGDAKKNTDFLEALRLAIEAQKQARLSAIAAANRTLDEQAALARARYKTSRGQVKNDYQELRDLAAINNFKARRAQREALADRGALNSGAGLQENLMLSSNYNNNLNKIGIQEKNAYDTLLNNLNSYLAQIDLQKANNENTTLENYNNVLASLINSQYSGYTPENGYLALASALAGGGNVPVTPGVYNSGTPGNLPVVSSTAASGVLNEDPTRNSTGKWKLGK